MNEQTSEREHAAPVEWESLMAAYQAADRASAETLMAALIPLLRRFFMSTADGRQSCDDLIQETLLRIHRARHSWRSSDPLLPWVYAIARHVRVDQFRKRHRTALREEAVEPEILREKPDPSFTGPETPDFETMMSYLPDSQREVVTMLKVLGMTVEEVARVTATSAGSVKQKAHRAYNRLRAVLQGAARNELAK